MGLIAITPLLVCAVVILFARRSAVVGAGTALAVALALIGWQETFSLSLAGARAALLDAVVLTLSAAIVIVPGLYFNALLKSHGAMDAIEQWVECLPYTKAHKALLLLFGLLPAVESLTGFGVSLFLAIPVFFHLFSQRAAYRLSMLGMNIMPWGTLALATVVGAGLSRTFRARAGLVQRVRQRAGFPAAVSGGAACDGRAASHPQRLARRAWVERGAVGHLAAAQPAAINGNCWRFGRHGGVRGRRAAAAQKSRAIGHCAGSPARLARFLALRRGFVADCAGARRARRA
ncbi:MAG: hypothetical protein LBP52_04195 [Burkholderiaceae bacterium]|jgi:lactate permease|nr:hypothetical protein [Burkholderiaceae bacterium]